MVRIHTYDAKLIEFSEGNLRNNHIYLRSALHLIPKNALGGSNSADPGNPISVHFNPGAVVEADLPDDKIFLRCRSEVGAVFRDTAVAAGDFVVFIRRGDREFELQKIRA